ncbi:MAG: hypothetical protein ABJP33_16845 [Pseudoruegeria sp.]
MTDVTFVFPARQLMMLTEALIEDTDLNGHGAWSLLLSEIIVDELPGIEVENARSIYS